MTELKRNRVAYLKINCGLRLKEIADRLGISQKLAEYYWECAKREIRGQPITKRRRQKAASAPSTPKVQSSGTCEIRCPTSPFPLQNRSTRI